MNEYVLFFKEVFYNTNILDVQKVTSTNLDVTLQKIYKIIILNN